MTSPHDHDGTKASADREIHRLFDGDLSVAERDALLEALRGPGAHAAELRAEVRAKLEGLGEVRAVVREAAHTADPEPIDADALWAQIAARVEGATADAHASSERLGSEAPERPSERSDGTRPALRVIEGGAAKAAAPGATKEKPGTDELRERERRVRQRRTMIMLVGGLAAAAAAVIAIVRPGERPAEDPVVAVGDGTDVAPLIDPLAAEQLRRTEVLAVDFGPNIGTVFSVEGAEGSRYAVVWLTDEAHKSPDAPAREEPDPEADGDEGAPDDTAHL